MYYSAGTYEAFAHPEKPKDVDKKSAYLRPSDELYHECRRRSGTIKGRQFPCAVYQQVPTQYRALQADDYQVWRGVTV